MHLYNYIIINNGCAVNLTLIECDYLEKNIYDCHNNVF